MRILADENCERDLIDGLRMAGHDVVTIVDIAPSIGDDEVFKIAYSDNRVLLTKDRDFGTIVEHSDARPPAVVLMRLEPLSRARRIEIVLRAFVELGDGIINRFIVIDPHQVRARAYKV